MDEQETDIGSRGSGTGKKKIVIAILAIAIIAALAYAFGQENGFSKLDVKNPSGLFGLASQQGINESQSVSDSNANVSEFKNLQLKASLKSEEFSITAENSFIQASAGSGIQAGNQMIKALDSKLKISGFSGSLKSSSQGIVISGNAGMVSNDSMSSEFSNPQEINAGIESAKIENLSLKSLNALVQGSIEVSTESGSAVLNISKNSRLILENFQGSAEMQNGELALNGSAESLIVRED